MLKLFINYLVKLETYLILQLLEKSFIAFVLTLRQVNYHYLLMLIMSLIALNSIFLSNSY